MAVGAVAPFIIFASSSPSSKISLEKMTMRWVTGVQLEF